MLRAPKAAPTGRPRLIVATGVSKAYRPPIPGIQLADGYGDAPADPRAYAGQHVLILGKGNSGFEMADQLIETAAVIHVASPESLKFAWQTHHVGHLRALHNNLLDTYQLKCQNAVLDATVERIERRSDGRFAVQMSYSHAGGEREELFYDRIICCAGFQFDAELFDPDCRPALVIEDRFPAQTSTWESTNVPDLFFAGTLDAVVRLQEDHLLVHPRIPLQHPEPPPSPGGALPRPAAAVSDAGGHRGRADGRGHRAGQPQLRPVAAVRLSVGRDRCDGRRRGPLLRGAPTTYVCESELGRAEHLYTVSLEFGPVQRNPFAIERKPDPARAAESAFLHPVVRRYTQGQVTDQVHLLENLYGEWWGREHHLDPLRRFFAGQLEPHALAAG